MICFAGILYLYYIHSGTPALLRPEKVAPEDTVLLCQMPVIKSFYRISIMLPTVEDSTAMIREFRSYAMANGVKAIRNLADGIVSDVTEIIEKEM